MQIELPLTTIFQVFVNNTNQTFLYKIDIEEFLKFQQIKVPQVGIELTTVLQDLRISFFAGSLEAAYSLNWGAQEIWGKGGGETLALL